MAKAKVKLAKKGLKATDSALKAFLSKAKDALKSGVNKGVVGPIVASVKAGTRTVKAADKKLIDVVTRQKRTKGGFIPAGRRGATAVKRGIARTGVYGGGAAGVAIAGDAVKKPKGKTKKELAEEKRIAAQKKSDADAAAAADATKRKAGKDIPDPLAAAIKRRKKDDDRVLPGIRPFGGVIAKALLGKDEKFGGDKGLIDFLRPSKWGKGKGKGKGKGITFTATPAVAAKRNMGGMMKKKEAPSRPAGYMNGGMANKTSANKTSARSKPKGVGAATGGYGKAMR